MVDLFEISSLFPRITEFDNLFFDSQLNFWTKTNGQPRRRADQWNLPTSNRIVYNLSASQLRNFVKSTDEFKRFLNSINDRENRSLKGKYIIAYIDGDGNPVIRNPELFATLKEAKQKMISYQAIDPNSRWCLFECVGELKVDAVIE